MSTEPSSQPGERGATIFMVIAAALILLLGSPCCCYFGAGLFFGMNELRTGNYKNPARNPQQIDKRMRDPKYDREWDREAAPQPDGPVERWRGARHTGDEPAP